jgi:hypothetical protein
MTLLINTQILFLHPHIYIPQISSNTGRVDNIVQGEVGNLGVVLEQKGKGLTDTTGSTKDSNLGEVGSRGGESALSSDRGEGTGSGKHCKEVWKTRRESSTLLSQSLNP